MTVTVLIIIVKIDLDASNSVPLYDNPLSCMNLDGIKVFFLFVSLPRGTQHWSTFPVDNSSVIAT